MNDDDREEPTAENEISPMRDQTGNQLDPELDPKTQNLTEWDQSPAATGHAAPKILPEDETPAAEQLVSEGVYQADRDQRLAAGDPDFEP